MSNFELMDKCTMPGGNGLSTTYLIHTNNGYNLQVINSPFSNCQIFSLSPFYLLLGSTEKCMNIMTTLREIRDLCKLGRNLCQVDITEGHFNNIKEYIKIHAKMKYTNLTTSKMVSLIIDLRD